MTEPRYLANRTVCQRTRREFLWQWGGGFTALPLLDLLTTDGVLADDSAAYKGVRRGAKHVVFFFLNGGPSQVDTFDHKPALKKYEGKDYHRKLQIGSNGRPVGKLTPSHFPFQKHGESGLEISSLFPHVAKHADDLCVFRSMHANTPTHSPGILQMNSGSIFAGRPSLGAWVNYGLGTLTSNLPSYVVMTDHRGGPRGGAAAWTSGFMPAALQGTLFRSQGAPILNLDPPEGVAAETQKRSLEVLSRLNEKHLAARGGESQLAARIKSYELAYRMQAGAAEAVDIDAESAETKTLYGLEQKETEYFGRQCLLTRRLLERGVRYVQLYSGGGADSWDAHEDVIDNHGRHCKEIDQPIAALMADVKRRGMWDDTLFIWGGEFGRTPTSEGVGKPGRDHNHYGFSMWIAGGGVKGGQAIGATDEVGFMASENRIHVSDLHATILHLLGMDHEKLTYFHDGLDQRLTGVQPHRVVHEAIA
ncbi:MAG: DUF1501 domain-containing protein [Pirellulaceae bacterium]|jgi:hypothetical protein|nr:DUF1501 domain-containing protein [Pirellulaceae bacterium]MDP7019401.1 DUF1501 domain-containing protein [Pirellulaceae bacterium]